MHIVAGAPGSRAIGAACGGTVAVSLSSGRRHGSLCVPPALLAHRREEVFRSGRE